MLTQNIRNDKPNRERQTYRHTHWAAEAQSCVLQQGFNASFTLDPCATLLLLKWKKFAEQLFWFVFCYVFVQIGPPHSLVSCLQASCLSSSGPLPCKVASRPSCQTHNRVGESTFGSECVTYTIGLLWFDELIWSGPKSCTFKLYNFAVPFQHLDKWLNENKM